MKSFMFKCIFSFFIVNYCYSINAEDNSAYSKTSSPLELPEVSIILDMEMMFSDNKDNVDKDKLRIKEAEIGFQGYLHPAIKADAVIAFEQEYEGDSVSTESDIEEAYLSFLELPLGFQADVGRKLINFGRINPIHPHHLPFSEMPLVLQSFLGHHNWNDDGILLSYLISNPLDLYIKLSGGLWNGKELGHSHSHDEEVYNDVVEEQEHIHEVISWEGHVYTGRIFTEIPFTEEFLSQFGYSIAKDEDAVNLLQGVDLRFICNWPNTYYKLKWHSEFLKFENDVHDISRRGFVSYVQFSLNKNVELGVLYNTSEFLNDEDEKVKGTSFFASYYFSHTAYVRGEFTTKKYDKSDIDENLFFIQMVWGIGPHSHRLDD